MSDSVEEPVVAAGEYVLGTLDATEMLEARTRQFRDPAFADAVAFWEDCLAPLGRLVEPVVPPPALWSRLALATGVREPATRNKGLRFWQAATAVATLVAAGLAVMVFLPNPPAPDVHFTAALAPLNVSVPFLADARPDGRIVITPVGNTPVTAGRALQLWELQPGAKAPVSLGLLSNDRVVVVVNASQPSAQSKLLVSEEPTGGSPTGQPTGRVLFGGTLTLVPQPGR